MKEIPLHNRGMAVVVDDEDYEWLNAYRWRANKAKKRWYAARTAYNPKRKIYMHREIVGAARGEHVDHRDRNGLNNTRSNLRLATPSQNQWNRDKDIDNTSGYKGVHKLKDDCWIAQIQHQNNHHYLGRFGDPVAAAKAYDTKARELHGTFAKTNFTEEQNMKEPNTAGGVVAMDRIIEIVAATAQSSLWNANGYHQALTDTLNKLREMRSAVSIEEGLRRLLASWTQPCESRCDHGQCPLLRELYALQTKSVLDRARLTVKPIVDREKQGEVIGDLMNMRLDAATASPAAPKEEARRSCLKCNHYDETDPRGRCISTYYDPGGSLVYCGCRCEFNATTPSPDAAREAAEEIAKLKPPNHSNDFIATNECSICRGYRDTIAAIIQRRCFPSGGESQSE